MQDLKNTQYFKVEKEPQMKVSDIMHYLRKDIIL